MIGRISILIICVTVAGCAGITQKQRETTHLLQTIKQRDVEIAGLKKTIAEQETKIEGMKKKLASFGAFE